MSDDRDPLKPPASTPAARAADWSLEVDRPSVAPEPDEVDLADAVAARALQRSANGAAVSAIALGVLATAFLVLAQGRLGPQSLPQVAILGLGQVVGLALALRCALRARALSRTDRRGSGPSEAESAARDARRTVLGLTVSTAAIAGCLLVTLRPFALTALSVVLSVAVLAQLVVVLTTLRRRLLRAARRLQV